MYKLIISIVPHNSGELINSAALKAGSKGGSIIMGRGTASNNIIQLLGFGDTSKDIVYIIVEDEIHSKICSEIITATEQKKAHFGVMFSIDVDNFIRSGNISEYKQQTINNNDKSGDKNMENTHQMINIIINKGYAEDAMVAARKAGAGGGTIIGARGTAKEGDAKFFGMEIVPEKDMLMILVPTEKAEAVINAIKELPCLSQPGSGIIFCNQANGFTLLGKKD